MWSPSLAIFSGRPLSRPAMLGSAVFWHVYDPAQVVIDYSRIIGYTMIHVSAFVVVGCIAAALAAEVEVAPPTLFLVLVAFCLDRKSTRLNSSHQIISYAVFCLKKKKIQSRQHTSLREETAL